MCPIRARLVHCPKGANSLRLLLVCIVVLLTSCRAKISSMPQSADEIDFLEDLRGDTGWAQWQESLTVHASTRFELQQAAEHALNTHGYRVKRSSASRGMVIGEHGMTAYDWNILAGVYFEPRPKKDESGEFAVRIIVEGSKDFGFLGDATGGAKPEEIAETLRAWLADVGLARRLAAPSGPEQLRLPIEVVTAGWDELDWSDMEAPAVSRAHHAYRAWNARVGASVAEVLNPFDESTDWSSREGAVTQVRRVSKAEEDELAAGLRSMGYSEEAIGAFFSLKVYIYVDAHFREWNH